MKQYDSAHKRPTNSNACFHHVYVVSSCRHIAKRVDRMPTCLREQYNVQEKVHIYTPAPWDALRKCRFSKSREMVVFRLLTSTMLTSATAAAAVASYSARMRAIFTACVSHAVPTGSTQSGSMIMGPIISDVFWTALEAKHNSPLLSLEETIAFTRLNNQIYTSGTSSTIFNNNFF